MPKSPNVYHGVGGGAYDVGTPAGNAGGKARDAESPGAFLVAPPPRSRSRSDACSNDDSGERKTWRPFRYSASSCSFVRFGADGPNLVDLAHSGTAMP